MEKDILDFLATNERPVCNISVYFNLLQTNKTDSKKKNENYIYQSSGPDECTKETKLRKVKLELKNETDKVEFCFLLS